MIGRTLSHFEITDRLGAGGMGEVYLARDTRLEREVALKVLPEEVADDPERLARLQREAKALAALDHPHIVTVFSVDEAEGVHFLTMAYVEGRSLDSLIPEGGLPVEELLDYAVPLADALRAAHERGIIHRDLKPANVMVDNDGRLRVLDFGLAKREAMAGPEMSQATTQAFGEGAFAEQMTREGTILGSYPYMSPEQAEGRPVDARSDLFSLGTMLYEMACGGRPFQGATGIAMITAILRDEPAPLAERRDDFPARFVEIVERCLQKDPERRYPSAAELHRELAELRREVVQGTAVPVSGTAASTAGASDAGAAESGAPESGTSASAKTEAAETPGRRQMIRQASIAAAIVVAVFAASWAWQSWRARDRDATPAAAAAPRISSIAVLPLTNLTGNPEQEYLVDGMTEALITDLSKIGALKVISRSSVMRYKGTDTPVSEIAAELGVDAVLEGSVVREGDRVGVSASLIEAATDTSLWAERFERDMTGILSLQAEIAQAIAGEVQVALTPEEESLLGAARAVDPAAYEAYLKGTFHLQKYTPQDFELALQYFEAALEIDPEYALAYVGQASVWVYSNQFGLLPPREANPKVMEPLSKALELDDSLAEAQFTLAAWKTWHEFDWEAAEPGFQRAIELNPNYAEARALYSHFLAITDRAEESTAQIERALELDPRNLFIQGLYGLQISMTGRIEDAIAQIRRTHEMAPGFDFGRPALANMLFLTGRKEESLAEFRLYREGIGDREILDALDQGEAEAGFEGAMRGAADLLAERSRSQWVQPTEVSMLYEHAGDFEEALAWLERGFEDRDPDMPYIGALRISEGLRDLPGFQELMLRMNLPAAGR